MQKGETFTVNCKHCGSNQKIHINDVIADNSPLMVVLATLATIIITIVFWEMGFIAFITIAFPVLVWNAHQRSRSAFNNYKRPRN